MAGKLGKQDKKPTATAIKIVSRVEKELLKLTKEEPQADGESWADYASRIVVGINSVSDVEYDGCSEQAQAWAVQAMECYNAEQVENIEKFPVEDDSENSSEQETVEEEKQSGSAEDQPQEQPAKEKVKVSASKQAKTTATPKAPAKKTQRSEVKAKVKPAAETPKKDAAKLPIKVPAKVVADAKAKKTPPPAPATSKTRKVSTGKKNDVDATITVLSKENPKRPTSDAHKRFELYKKHTTVGGFLRAGGTRADLSWDTRHKFIRVA